MLEQQPVRDPTKRRWRRDVKRASRRARPRPWRARRPVPLTFMGRRIGAGRRVQPLTPTPHMPAAAGDEAPKTSLTVQRAIALGAPGLGETSPAADPGLERLLVQAFALVGEAIAGATHALLAGNRQAAKQLVEADEAIDALIDRISRAAQQRLVSGHGDAEERQELVAILRMLPDLERSGDLAEHVARRAARGLGTEMSARSRGLVERMGEVAVTIWRATTDTFAERSAAGASIVDDLDDEMDDLHVSLTAEIVSGTMPLAVAIELAMVARFYERFGDHAVNLARRIAALADGNAGSVKGETQE